MGLTSDSSSEDDEDIYVRSAARLKALKKKAPLVIDDHSPKLKKQENNDIPDFWSSGTSEPRKRKNSSASCPKFNNHKERPVSPDVETTAKDNDDLPIFERSLDSSDRPATGVATEDDNYKMNVKVKWKSRDTVRLELRKYESFEKVFKHFAQTEGVSEKQIIILKGNRQIHKGDTPASMDLKIIDILEGGVVNTDVVAEEQDIEDKTCKIKVQMSTKQKIVVDLKMDEKLKTVVLICAEKLNVAPSRIKLSFDGDEIALTDTPESLDLEQEACIDLRVVTS